MDGMVGIDDGHFLQTRKEQREGGSHIGSQRPASDNAQTSGIDGGKILRSDCGAGSCAVVGNRTSVQKRHRLSVFHIEEQLGARQCGKSPFLVSPEPGDHLQSVPVRQVSALDIQIPSVVRSEDMEHHRPEFSPLFSFHPIGFFHRIESHRHRNQSRHLPSVQYTHHAHSPKSSAFQAK